MVSLITIETISKVLSPGLSLCVAPLLYVLWIGGAGGLGGAGGAGVSVEGRLPLIDAMSQQRLEQIILNTAQQGEGGGGAVRCMHNEVQMLCLSDVAHDRMRIIAPILDEADLTDVQRQAMLEANFHTALDVRYATSHGTVYAVYIHPLSPLDERQIKSAMDQVANLVKTFGTQYTSGAMHFGQQ